MAHAPFPAGRWRHAPFPPVGGIIGARTVPSRWRDQQCGGNSASRWRRCCGCSASRWRLSASHWRRGRWRLPPRQQWRWHSGGQPGASACQSHSPVPDVLGGGIRKLVKVGHIMSSYFPVGASLNDSMVDAWRAHRMRRPSQDSLWRCK